MSRIDEFRIAELTRRLEVLRGKWDEIAYDPEFSRGRIPSTGAEEAARDVAETRAKDQAITDVRYYLLGVACFDSEFCNWASDVVDAFGAEAFPQYCNRPPLPAGDVIENRSLFLLTGVENLAQAGLRVILWVAATREPSLLLRPNKWQPRESLRCDLEEWAKALVIRDESGYVAEPDVMQWVEKGFASLVKGFQQKQSSEVLTHGRGGRKRASHGSDTGKVAKQGRNSQSSVDAELLKFQIENQTKINDLACRIAAGDKASKKEARLLFGRNKIADKLDLPRSMVSKTPAYKEVSKTLKLSRNTSGSPRPVMQGLDITLESVSIAAGDLVEHELAIREMLAKIDAAIRVSDDADVRKGYEAIRMMVETGKKSVEWAQSTVAEYEEQLTDKRLKTAGHDAGLVK